MSQTVRMHYNPLQSFLGADPDPDAIDTINHILEWQVNNIASGDLWDTYITFTTPPPPTVPLGTLLNYSASIHNSSCSTTDTLEKSLELMVVGSYDPNDKSVSPVGFSTHHGVNTNNHPEFTYLVRFQNTGTFLAENVTVIDTMSQYLNLSTLKVLSASHNYDVAITGRAVKFLFRQIMLPDSNANEPGSHGYIQYSIRPYIGLPQNTVINNRADIYFDFNEPILTNTTLTTVDYTNYAGVPGIDAGYNFNVYPNPTTGIVQLTVNKAVIGNEIKLVDISGRILATQRIENETPIMQIQDLAKGLYFVRIGNSIKKLLKE